MAIFLSTRKESAILSPVAQLMKKLPFCHQSPQLMKKV
jgi:hypothetical protein